MPSGLHDAHAQPPGDLRAQFKKWQKMSVDEISTDRDVIDTFALDHDSRVKAVALEAGWIDRVCESFHSFLCTTRTDDAQLPPLCFEVYGLPGLLLYPQLLLHDVQCKLLDSLLHHQITKPQHNSNLHLHYEMSQLRNSSSMEGNDVGAPNSLFRLDYRQQILPKDPEVHKPLTIKQVLDKKLRWVTLGGQYDWTKKVYPEEVPPDFPSDIAQLLTGIFHSVDPQAAILNFYSPGDTLSLHRDVSEECDRGLVSVSIGCDALFMASNDDASNVVTIRLRSGDVLLMSGESRFAWHAGPKILLGTCPKQLQDWPAIEEQSAYTVWKGWLSGKRLNLNVRQMRETSEPDQHV